MNTNKPPSRHESFIRADAAIATVVPPAHRLHTISDDELLGYSDALWGNWKDLGDEWTRRQMAREEVEPSERATGT